jgi:hypothetical protein
LGELKPTSTLVTLGMLNLWPWGEILLLKVCYIILEENDMFVVLWTDEFKSTAMIVCED